VTISLIIHPTERSRLCRLARGIEVAKYKKKRARELQHDRFRDTTIGFFDRLGNLLEGRGRTILYGLAGILLAGILIIGFVKWSNRKTDEARQALAARSTSAPRTSMPPRSPAAQTPHTPANTNDPNAPSRSLKRSPPSMAIRIVHKPAISSPRIAWSSIAPRA